MAVLIILMMASFAAVADAARQFDQGTFDIANAWSNRQNVYNSSAANAMNAQNLVTALQASQDSQEFYSKTAGLDALITSTSSQFGGIGRDAQDAQLMSNTNAMVTQQGLALEERATQTMINATNANAQNTNSANNQNSTNSAILQTAHAGGGMIGTAVASIILAIEGGKTGLNKIEPLDAPQLVQQLHVNQNTAYSTAGMVDPTTMGHHQYIQDTESHIYDTISDALSSSTAPPPYESDTQSMSSQYSAASLQSYPLSDVSSLSSFLSGGTDSSHWSASWYPNGVPDQPNPPGPSGKYEPISDTSSVSSVPSSSDSSLNVTWYPNGVESQQNQPEAVRSMGQDPTSLVGNVRNPVSAPNVDNTASTPDPTPHSEADDGSASTPSPQSDEIPTPDTPS